MEFYISFHRKRHRRTLGLIHTVDQTSEMRPTLDSAVPPPSPPSLPTRLSLVPRTPNGFPEGMFFSLLPPAVNHDENYVQPRLQSAETHFNSERDLFSPICKRI